MTCKITESLCAITGTTGYYRPFEDVPMIAFNRTPSPHYFTIIPTTDGLIVGRQGWRVEPCVHGNKIYFRLLERTDNAQDMVCPLALLQHPAFIKPDEDSLALPIAHPTNWKVTA